jgi:hypothetical protein
MADNILVLAHDVDVGARTASSLALEYGDVLGLVDTRTPPEAVRKVGSRIEEERTWGGTKVSAFDEPLTVGSALAQLAGFADAMLVDRLDDWAVKLTTKYGDDEDDRITAEILGLTTMMTADLAHIVLLSRPAGGAGRVASVHARILAAIAPHVTRSVTV